MTPCRVVFHDRDRLVRKSEFMIANSNICSSSQIFLRGVSALALWVTWGTTSKPGDYPTNPLFTASAAAICIICSLSNPTSEPVLFRYTYCKQRVSLRVSCSDRRMRPDVLSLWRKVYFYCSIVKCRFGARLVEYCWDILRAPLAQSSPDVGYPSIHKCHKCLHVVSRSLSGLVDMDHYL